VCRRTEANPSNKTKPLTPAEIPIRQNAVPLWSAISGLPWPRQVALYFH
jgi:hypothetical protein